MSDEHEKRDEEEPRKCVACNGRGTVYPGRGPAVRLDTLKNRVAATSALLLRLAAQAEDLHALAYDRPRALAEKVRSPAGDYALDTHGDQRARRAYRYLAQVTVELAELATEAAHDAGKILTEGSSGVSRRTVSARQLAQAITAQAARIKAGDYVPSRQFKQPDHDTALEVVTKETERLERLVEKISRAIPGSFKQGSDDVLAQVRKLAQSWQQNHTEKDKRRGYG